MTEMVCILCPRGCRLTVSEGPEWAVQGNGCPRGAVYGRSEAESPVRVVTATCRARIGADLAGMDLPKRIPLKTSAGVPKSRAPELARQLLLMEADLPVREGEVLIEDWESTGVSVIVTRTIPSRS